MSLKVVVIGAGGLVGIRVAEQLVRRRDMRVSPTETVPLTSIVLMDLNDARKMMPQNDSAITTR